MALIAPTVESIGDEALTNSIIDRSITELQDNIVTTLGSNALRGCSNLKRAVFGAATSMTSTTFDGCTSLETLDFHNSLSVQSLEECTSLTALILRGDTVCSAAMSSYFSNTPIYNGTGYIYVPAALADSYKAKPPWSSSKIVSQIRAIEDYPLICGTAGKVWFKGTSPGYGQVSCVRYADGVWVAAKTNYGLRYSEDGKTWHAASITSGSFSCLVYADGLWTAAPGSAGNFYSSEDGKTWDQLSSGPYNIRSMCYSGGVWLVASTDKVYRSVDRKTWEDVTPHITTENRVGVGADGIFTVYNRAGIWLSEDGISWSGITGSCYWKYVRTVRYAAGLWVAGSLGDGLHYSEDGKAWTQSNVPSGDFYAVAYENGMWVAGGPSGAYYSEDGKTWGQASAEGLAVQDLYFADGLWVAGSSNGTGLWYSLDGKTWSQSNIATASYHSVYCANGLWVAGDSSSPAIACALYYSE